MFKRNISHIKQPKIILLFQERNQNFKEKECLIISTVIVGSLDMISICKAVVIPFFIFPKAPLVSIQYPQKSSAMYRMTSLDKIAPKNENSSVEKPQFLFFSHVWWEKLIFEKGELKILWGMSPEGKSNMVDVLIPLFLKRSRPYLPSVQEVAPVKWNRDVYD